MAKPVKDIVIRYMDSTGEYYLAYAKSYQPVFRYAFNQWATVEAAKAAIKEYNRRPKADYRLNLVENTQDQMRGPIGAIPSF